MDRPAILSPTPESKDRFEFRYFPALDGIRALAVFLVVVFHARGPLFMGGFIGVDIFFVLSGFLITGMLLREVEQSGRFEIKQFYLRRIFRLFPALAFLLLVFLVVSLILCEPERAAFNAQDALIALFYSANWSYALGSKHPDLLRHCWSLSVEEQFYFIWPPLLYFLIRKSTSMKPVLSLIAALIAASYLWRNVLLFQENAPFRRVYLGLDTRADTLLVGCLLAVWLAQNGKQWATKRHGVLNYASMFGLVGLLTISFLDCYKSTYMVDYGFTVVQVLTVMLIAPFVMGTNGALQKLFEARALVYIGRLSYSLYLWHYPIFRTMHYYHYEWYTVLLFGGAAAVALSAFSYTYIERPYLALKTRHQSAVAPRVERIGSREAQEALL